LVVAPSKPLPIRDEVADLVIATSALEHDPFFWNTFLELMRVLKPGGFLYLSAPSNGAYHRHPTDQWRFYPDAGKCLESWGRHCGTPTRLVESFIADRQGDIWNDFVAVFAKSDALPDDAQRLLCETFPCRNVWKPGATDPAMFQRKTEEMELLNAARQEVARLEADLEAVRLKAAESERTLGAHVAQLEHSLATIRDSRVWRLTQGVMSAFGRRDGAASYR
jgi:SAM-dependent methyltransferase